MNRPSEAMTKGLSRFMRSENAKHFAEIFAGNSLDGIYSHGMNRYPRYISDMESGICDSGRRWRKPSSFCTACRRWRGAGAFMPPGEGLDRTHAKNRENGIPVTEETWARILQAEKENVQKTAPKF